LLGITKPIPPVTAHDKSLHTQFDTLVKAPSRYCSAT
jgi:oleate hydratase